MKIESRKFRRMGGGSAWVNTCHPAYSLGEILVSHEDVFIVNIKDLPAFLKHTKVWKDLVPLKTDAEKKATRDRHYNSVKGKEVRDKYEIKCKGQGDDG